MKSNVRAMQQEAQHSGHSSGYSPAGQVQMNRPRRRLLLPIVLLACLLPSQAFSQEIVRLFDLEVEEHFALADPGRVIPAIFWHSGSSGVGLFDQAAAFAGLTQPRLLLIEGDELFLVDGADGTRVLVYSLPGLELTRSFGGDGDGPGQFRVRPGHRIGLDVTADRIIVTGGGKVSLFNRSGVLLGEAGFPFWTQWEFKSLGAGYVGEGSDPDSSSYLLNLYDSELSPIKEVLRTANPVSPGGGAIRVLTTAMQFAVYDDELYVWGHTPDLVIEVFNKDGSKARSLQRDYERVPVSEEIRSMVLRAYSADPAFAGQMDELLERIVFPSHLPAIWNCYVDDETIYVLTYERQGWEFRMLAFDTAGNALGSALLPVRLSPANTPYPATVHDGHWYQIAKNGETGEWEIIVLEIPF